MEWKVIFDAVQEKAAPAADDGKREGQCAEPYRSGGGKMTLDMKQTALDIMDGKITEDEAIENIKKKYGFPS